MHSLRYVLFFLPLVFAVSATIPAIAQQTSPGTPTPELRPGDEIWVVSSRGLGSRHCDFQSLETRQYINGQWYSSNPSSLIVSGAWNPTEIMTPPGVIVAPKPMVMLVHGNSWSFTKAVQRGMQTYQETITPWHDKPPLRFVIWTWPSDSIAGPIRDIRIKSDRAEEHGFHLARFLQQLPSSTQVSIIGFSYGARVALGALNLLGGGVVNGGRISSTSMPSPQINVTLIAPAIRNDALVTTMPNAYRQINHLFVMYNSRDRYLAFFRLAKFSGKTPALGFTGIKCRGCLPNASARIDQFDAAQLVGRDHDYLEYIRDRSVEQRLRRNMFIGPI